jgi:uncharacterized repeat protein (TIGR03803 family)
MSNKKFLAAASAALLIVTVLTLMLPPAAEAADKFKELHRFYGSDGINPSAALIFDAAGNLYSTTLYGGAYKLGTVFKLTPNADGGWTESVLHSFNGSDGSNPYAGLIFDAAGNLYGTTYDGAGTVFKLMPNADGSWTESVLHTFNGGSDGAYLQAGLIFDAAGNLYGTTLYGGADNLGTVFMLTPNADGSWTESVLHSFSDESHGPSAGLILDAAGNLYGTTSYGGAHNMGTVFMLTPNVDGSWTESVLHSFNNSEGEPIAGLIFDAAGNLYGTTYDGGAHNFGTVFMLTPTADGSWTESVLHSFNGSDGSNPYAGLIFDAAGNLCGTTRLGGSEGGGTAFELSPNQDGNWEFSLLHVFKGKPALGPFLGSLVLGSAGTLYGTAEDCNNRFFRCQGVVYQITP